MVLLENETPSWADGNDDDGTLTEGAALDASLFDGYRNTLDAQLHSTTNPGVRPNAITDEVVNARGNLGSLAARILPAVDVNGALNFDLPTGRDFYQSAGGINNWIYNDDFKLWSLGDTSAPDGWALSGAGAAIQRCGTGLADTQRYGIGDFVARITFGSAAAILTQNVIPSGTIATRILQMLRQIVGVPATGDILTDQQSFGVGIACFATTANQAYIKVDQGASTQSSGFHPGDGTWRILLTGILGTLATKLTVEAHVDITGGAAYFSLPFLIPFTLGTVEQNDASAFNTAFPMRLMPCRQVRREWTVPLLAGAQTVRNNIWRAQPRRPCIITDVQLSATTGPTVTALIYDLKSWDGGAFTSMFSTLPQIAAGQTRGGAQPDGTYARRCLNPYFGTAIAAGGEIRLDCTQIGGGVAGSDVAVTIGYVEYERPLDGFYQFDTE